MFSSDLMKHERAALESCLNDIVQILQENVLQLTLVLRLRCILNENDQDQITGQPSRGMQTLRLLDIVKSKYDFWKHFLAVLRECNLAHCADRLEKQLDIELSEPAAKKRLDTDQAVALDVDRFATDLADYYRTVFSTMLLFQSTAPAHITQIYVNMSWERVDFRGSRKQINDDTELLRDWLGIDLNGRRQVTHNPKVLLVQAEAGRGKTAFTKKLSFEWSRAVVGQAPQQYQFLSAFKILFVAALRSVTPNGNNLLDLVLNAQLLSNLPGSYDTKSIKNWANNHPEQVLIILDGYDEFVAHDETVTVPSCSKCAQLDQVLYHNSLARFPICLTTRPYATTGIICSRIDARICGLLEDQVVLFIEKYMDKQKARMLDYYTNSKPQQKHLFEIPLITHMCCLLVESGGNLPANVSDLFANILMWMLSNANQRASTRLRYNITSWKQAPVVKYLARAAFERMYKSQTKQLLLYEFDANEAAIREAEHIGLISKNYQPTLFGQSLAYSFIHKSMQEFLCAVYVSSVDCPNDDLQRFKSAVDFNFYAELEVLKYFIGIAEDLEPMLDMLRDQIYRTETASNELGMHCWDEMLPFLKEILFECNSDGIKRRIARDLLSVILHSSKYKAQAISLVRYHNIPLLFDDLLHISATFYIAGHRYLFHAGAKNSPANFVVVEEKNALSLQPHEVPCMYRLPPGPQYTRVHSIYIGSWTGFTKLLQKSTDWIGDSLILCIESEANFTPSISVVQFDEADLRVFIS